jgi:hydroxymethylpyrimidine kinase/phosphomethylpyrimidine kinase
MRSDATAAVALTVAGSDSGGGAGIQADLKTFHSLGVFGASAITCVTAQNPGRVSAIESVSVPLVAGQIDRVFEAFRVRAAKTGMLYNAAIIETVADCLRRHRLRKLVVDPVMVASSGALLLRPDAIAALRGKLLPRALLVTPNRAEAERLWGRPIRSIAEQRAAAETLAGQFGVAFLVKGGHMSRAERAVDVLFDGRGFAEFGAARVRNARTHGAGCAYSAAIAANLALGRDLTSAIQRAKRFITGAIRGAVALGRYRALSL